MADDVNEVNRKYITFKAKKIKELAKKGNRAAASRHATELAQYMGWEDDERPIEDMLD